MTEAATVFTRARDEEGGRDLGRRLLAQLDDRPPEVVILFASPANDLEALVGGLRETCRPGALVGCSSAGEFSTGASGEGASSAVGMRSSEMAFTAVMTRDLQAGPEAAAGRIVAGFQGTHRPEFRHRAALVLTDALGGLADELVSHLTVETAGTYKFFGGGAGDDAQFTRTQVFRDNDMASDAVVALEILSNRPLGVGVRHGWAPAGPPLRVTEAEGVRVVSLNAAPAVEAFQAHAEATGQAFDAAEPLPFFLHNILGLAGPGGYKLRVPLAVAEDGSVVCAAELPEGSTAHIMAATSASAAEAAATATRDAVGQLAGHEPGVALFFDCVATRLRLGRDFGVELEALQEALGDAPFAGFNTYGQVARAEGQFSGFHNCTAVVCVIPR